MLNLSFTRRSDGSSATIGLYSRFTCIYGEDSGEEKTYFFETVRRYGIYRNHDEADNDPELDIDMHSEI